MPPAFTSRVMNTLSTRSAGMARLLILSAGVWAGIAFDATTTFGQTPTPLLTSRDELSAAVTRAEQSGNPAQAAAIRARLTAGDFQPGDRIILTYFSDVIHTDTLIVREGRVVDLLATKTVLSLQGVLRSELKDRLTTTYFMFIFIIGDFICSGGGITPP